MLQDLLLKLTLIVGVKQFFYVDQCVRKVCSYNLQAYIFRSSLPCGLFNEKGLGCRVNSFSDYEGFYIPLFLTCTGTLFPILRTSSDTLSNAFASVL